MDLEQYKDDTAGDVIAQLAFNLLLSAVLPMVLVITGWFSSLNFALGFATVSLGIPMILVSGLLAATLLIPISSNFISIYIVGSLRDGVRPLELFRIVVYGTVPITVSQTIPILPNLFKYALAAYSAFIVYNGLQHVERMQETEALYVFGGALVLQLLVGSAIFGFPGLAILLL